MDFGFNFSGNGRMHLQKFFGRISSLPDPLGAVTEPGAALVDDLSLHADVDQLSGLGNSLRKHDVKLGLLERRRHFVFDDLHPDAAAMNLLPLFDGFDPANVEAHGGVKL